MLTLSRKHGEAIIINGDIRVVVMIDGNKVKLGIDAPKDVSIVREELIARMVAKAKQE